MKHSWVLSAAGGLVATACAGTSIKPEAVTKAQGFAGPEGVKVEVLDLGPDSALIRVRGVDGDFGDMVLRHEVERQSSAIRYHTTYNGKPFYTLSWRQRQDQWTLYAAGHPKNPVTVRYDEAMSTAIDVDDLLSAHDDQLEDGSLEKLATFDRSAAEAGILGELKKNAERTSKECGMPIEVSVDWASIDQPTILKYSIASYCDNGLAAARNLCRRESVKRYLSGAVKRFTCGFGPKHALTVRDGTLAWTAAVSESNLGEKARTALEAHSTGDMTLGAMVDLDRTEVCRSTDKKQVVVVGAARNERFGGLSHGDGKAMIRLPQLRYLGTEWFLEPRHPAMSRNANFRGYDMRFHSSVEVNAEKDTCALVCGERSIEMERLSGNEKAEIIKTATFTAREDVREPYALARDKSGTYYFVDRGSTEDMKKDFRLYVGRRGRLRLQKMKDIVSDSEGEIFSSTRGDLKLVLGKGAAQWIRGQRKPKELVWVPVHENLGLIYNDLGVYVGKRLQTPCDDH